MMVTWDQLYDMAKGKLDPRRISPFIEAGGVAAAILTDKGNVYVACASIHPARWGCAPSVMPSRI